MESYHTDNEIEFIKGLGTFSAPGKKIGKKILLKLYLAAVPLRNNLAGLDKAIITNFAQAELEECKEETP